MAAFDNRPRNSAQSCRRTCCRCRACRRCSCYRCGPYKMSIYLVEASTLDRCGSATSSASLAATEATMEAAAAADGRRLADKNPPICRTQRSRRLAMLMQVVRSSAVLDRPPRRPTLQSRSSFFVDGPCFRREGSYHTLWLCPHLPWLTRKTGASSHQVRGKIERGSALGGILRQVRGGGATEFGSCSGGYRLFFGQTGDRGAILTRCNFWILT